MTLFRQRRGGVSCFVGNDLVANKQGSFIVCVHRFLHGYPMQRCWLYGGIGDKGFATEFALLRTRLDPVAGLAGMRAIKSG